MVAPALVNSRYRLGCTCERVKCNNQYFHPVRTQNKQMQGCFVAGRLSHSLGSKNTALSLIMGPPEVWQAPEGPTLAPQRAGQRQSALDSRAANKSPGAALHEALQQQLRSGKVMQYVCNASCCMMVLQVLDNLSVGLCIMYLETF